MNDLNEGEKQKNKVKEKRRFRAIVKGNKTTIEDTEGINEFYENSYIGEKISEGEKELLELTPIEVLLLHERDRIFIIKDEEKSKEISQIEISTTISQELYEKIKDNSCSFEELMIYFAKFDSNLWQRYVVYNDLRKRGYFVRAGYGEGFEFRVFKRGADFRKDSAKYLIYPIFEGIPIKLKELDHIARTSLNDRKEVIIAAVDRLSKPIYYNVKKFTPETLDI